jgi:hypothetical protein
LVAVVLTNTLNDRLRPGPALPGLHIDFDFDPQRCGPRAVVIRGEKFTFDFVLASHGDGIDFRGANMPANMRAQLRETRKNYIGIVSHTFDEQCAVELQAKSDHRVKDYLFHLIALVLKRRDDV